MKKLIPKFLMQIYHWLLARLSAVIYGRPSKKMIIIGITGTSGKSTAAELISSIFEQAGFRIGLASTIKFKIAYQEKINDKKMTMIGRFQLQKFLKQMLKTDCKYAIIETTSEGIRQFRHLGIHYDVLVFTNLYPEHIDSHGSFENYKKAKLKLFKHLEKQPHKILNNKCVPKTIIANIDDEHAKDFLNFKVDEKYGYGIQIKDLRLKIKDIKKVIRAEKIEITNKGINFQLSTFNFQLYLFGEHNIYNVLAAISVGLSQGISLEKIKQALGKIKTIPGRLEFVNQGQSFKIIVDYAFEPKAMEKLYEVARNLNCNKIIQVLGTTGGGRDKERGEILGRMAGETADLIIATNEDPYNDDPEMLMNRIIKGAQKAGKKLNKDLLKILDRRQAIQTALSRAQENDLVLITGKGSEQAMVVKNKKIPWDDRKVVREELGKITN